MKKTFKVYLKDEEHKRLIAKAEEMGIRGRGALSQFLRRLAYEKIIFLDGNIRKFIELLNLKIPETAPKE